MGITVLVCVGLLGCQTLGPGFLNRFVDERGMAVAADAGGNICVTGEFSGSADFDPGPAVEERTSIGGSDIFLCKYDSTGNFLWARTWGGARHLDFAGAVGVDSSGDIYAAGIFENTVDFDPGPGLDEHTASHSPGFWVTKFDESGDWLWTRTWDGAMWDVNLGLTIDGSGNVLVTGQFSGQVDFDPGPGEESHKWNGNCDTFCSEFDSTGNFLGVRTSGGTKDSRCRVVAADRSGNTFVAGFFGGTVDFDPGPTVDMHACNGWWDVYLIKFRSPGDFFFDSTETFLWARTWGGPSVDYAWGLAVDSGGSAYITGYFSESVDFDPGPGVDNHESEGDWDIYVSKLDSSGNFLWARTWGGGGRDQGYGVAVDGAGNVLVTGSFSGAVDFDPGSGVDKRKSNSDSDVFLSKFDSSGNFLWARTWGGANRVVP